MSLGLTIGIKKTFFPSCGIYGNQPHASLDPYKKDAFYKVCANVHFINAAAYGNLEALKIICNTYPQLNPNVVNEEGMTALHKSCVYGHTSTVKWLLEEKHVNPNTSANPNISSLESTPLFAALNGGFTPVVNMLLDAGANKNIILPDGFTILHLAAFLGDIYLVRELINENEIDVNAPWHGPANITSAGIAYSRGHNSILELIIQAGGTLNKSQNFVYTKHNRATITIMQVKSKPITHNHSNSYLFFQDPPAEQLPQIEGVSYKCDNREPLVKLPNHIMPTTSYQANSYSLYEITTLLSTVFIAVFNFILNNKSNIEKLDQVQYTNEKKEKELNNSKAAAREK